MGATTEAGEFPRGGFWSRPLVVALTYLVLACVFAAMGLRGMWNVFSVLDGDFSPWWTVATAAPSCAAALLKRRAPLVGLLVAIPLFLLDLLTVGGVVSLLVLLELLGAYTTGLDAERRRRVLGAITVAAVVMAATAFVLSREPEVLALIGLQFGGLLGFTYWYANSLAQSRELVLLYRGRAEDAARLADLDRAQAVQDEREAMARELHDVVAGHVSAVAIRSEAALAAAAARDDAGSGSDATPELRALGAVRDSSLAAHEALRGMIGVLRDAPERIVVRPGLSRIEELVAEANRSGITVVLAPGTGEESAGGGEPEPAPLSEAADLALGAVAQEALANCVRHAAGGTATVAIERRSDRTVLVVRSRGGAPITSPALRGSGLGLALMRERAASIGGRVSAGPGGATGDEWVVRAEAPVGPRREGDR